MSTGTCPATYVVDVCGTLVQDDTTLGLLLVHFVRSRSRRPLRPHILSLLSARSSPARWAFVLLERVTGKHWLKRVLVGLLAGDKASDLDASGLIYARELLCRRRVAPVWERLRKTSRPNQVILASASLEPVVRALAELIGARYVASSLEVRGGVLTGRYIEDLTGRKEAAISLKFGPNALNEPFAAFSDNLSDRPLLSKAFYACVVLHRASHRARWTSLSADYVRVED